MKYPYMVCKNCGNSDGEELFDLAAVNEILAVCIYCWPRLSPPERADCYYQRYMERCTDNITHNMSWQEIEKIIFNAVV